ncbi:hypothetical protein BofuT4_uP133830.1 [Botrytis cinerea T4]|uniref:Uncharacterized protein n=1 Tax=Botryotinia fuckeliana (strain T4) TaxID=999810 RepID=G2YQD1_BOTF4|nr:hypothetical protein BofuT4_uP133830.1 [Botrytis cinerea T4]
MQQIHSRSRREGSMLKSPVGMLSKFPNGSDLARHPPEFHDQRSSLQSLMLFT